MAQATTITFGKQAIRIGNGADPEVFAAPCGFTELSMTVNTETSTTNVPDCDDPDLASWLESDEVSKQMVLTGQGVLAQQALPTWQNWSIDGGRKNVQWFRNLSSGAGGGYFVGPALLTQYEERGSRGNKWQVSVQITFDGKPTFVPAV